MRFESSTEEAGKLVSLDDYAARMPEDQKNIYFLCATNRAAAEGSPYLEALKQNNVEVIHQPHVLWRLVYDLGALHV